MNYLDEEPRVAESIVLSNGMVPEDSHREKANSTSPRKDSKRFTSFAQNMKNVNDLYKSGKSSVTPSLKQSSNTFLNFSSLESPYKSKQNNSYSMRYASTTTNKRGLCTTRAFEPFTSPGDYDLPPVIGNKVNDSSKFSFPAFSFAGKETYRQRYLGKEQIQDSIGYDSPGVGKYNSVESSQAQAKSPPKFSVPRSPRFDQSKIHSEFISNIPVSYLGTTIDDSEREKSRSLSPQNILGTGFGTARKRFAGYDPQNPGPGTYLTFSQSVEKKRGNSSFGCTFDQSKKIYNKEYAKEFYGREGVGPGCYGTFEHINKKEGAKFPQVDRNLLILKKNNGPNPFSYDAQMPQTTTNKGRYSMGKADRDWDLRKMGGLHNTFWSKGVFK